MNKGLVSVIMANYNTDLDYLKEAIDSIYSQTYKNFEIIMIDDYSTNNPEKIYDTYDERFKLVKNKENMGVTVSRNLALELVRGEFVFIMDSDDIAYNNVIETEVNYFRENEKANVVGVGIEFFGLKSGEYIPELPNTREWQQVKYIFYNYGIQHIATMMRKSFLDEYNIKYNEKYKKALDYALFWECTNYSKIDIISKVYIKYRQHEKQISTATKENQDYWANQIKLDKIKILGVDLNSEEEKLHLAFCKLATDIELISLYKWVKKIIKANNKCKYYDKKEFKKQLLEQMRQIFYKNYKEDRSYYHLLLYILVDLKSIVRQKILNISES